ncbi:MAG: MFS transporter [Firmicutes bacterium]|nr:MFS transporter [Bacillota bacterium]
MRIWNQLVDPTLPRAFYVLLIGRFFNLVGNSLVFPFITIYLAERLHAPMSTVGIVMTFYGGAQVLSVLVGGVWSDKLGRRRVMLLSLILGAAFTFLMGLSVNSALLIVFLTGMGFTVPLFQPASMAAVGDMVPPDRLSYAYGLMRMASNAGIIIGPMLGGFLADHSFFLIFALDALSMIGFLIVIWTSIAETRPVATPTHTPSRLRDVARDPLFLRFAGLWGLTSLVYSQLFMVVPAYLHLQLGYPPSVFGYLAAENAVLVVTLQLPITRITRHLAQPTLMALGTLCYGTGFWLMLSGHEVTVFAAAVLVITVGENFINPAASAWVADRAPENLRGRYMGFFSLANRAGFAVGPLTGGFLMGFGILPWLGTTGALGFVASLGYQRFSRKNSQASSLGFPL